LPTGGSAPTSTKPFHTGGYPSRLEDEKRKAEAAIRHLVPKSPASIVYRKLWSTILLHHMVRMTDVNTICADMRKKEELLFPDWEARRRVPQDNYRVQRAE
jgi:hypothetical protein